MTKRSQEIIEGIDYLTQSMTKIKYSINELLMAGDAELDEIRDIIYDRGWKLTKHQWGLVDKEHTKLQELLYRGILDIERSRYQVQELKEEGDRTEE